MATEATQAFLKLRIVGHDHATFPGGHVLYGVVAENGHLRPLTITDGFALIGCPHGMRRVLDDRKAFALSQLSDGFEVNGSTRQVYWNHRFRLRRDHGLDGLRCDQSGVGIDIGKDGVRPHIASAIRRREKCDRGYDDVVAGSQTQRVACCMESGSAVAYGDACPGIDSLSNCSFEVSDLRPRREIGRT